MLTQKKGNFSCPQTKKYLTPITHHKHLKSTNLLERLNEELKRRTLVVRIVPNPASCLRLSRALAVEMHENWIEAMRYLNMDLLREQCKARGQVGAVSSISSLLMQAL
jgi:transposase-like protein